MRVFTGVLMLLGACPPLMAQPTELTTYAPTPDQWQLSSEAHAPHWAGARAFKLQIEPHWSENGDTFWYANDLPLFVNDIPVGQREFIRIHATTGARVPAFDHQRLVQSLYKANVPDAYRLSLSDLKFVEEGIEFRLGKQTWHCSLLDYELTQLKNAPHKTALRHQGVPRSSRTTGPETFVTFVNQSEVDVELFWLDDRGTRRSYGKLAPGDIHKQHTFTGHVWEVISVSGHALGRYQAEESGADVEITSSSDSPEIDDLNAVDAPVPRHDPLVSPDGQWSMSIRDHNVVAISSQGEERTLTRDGTVARPYELQIPCWSGDSKHVVAFRVDPAQSLPVYLLESSPEGGGRAKLHVHQYPLPGDQLPAYDLYLFDVIEQEQQMTDVRLDFQEPRIRWAPDGRYFTLDQIDRGHQRFRVHRVDSHTGKSQTLIDERSTTFIWTAHAEERGVDLVTWLDDSKEFIYSTERSGWRHLELHDGTTGELKGAITSGEYVVRGIDWIDDRNRQVWFRASGREPGEDPYFIHYYRVNFDGSSLIRLTEGNGNHSVQYSPDRRFLIDTYSRVDAAPVHELRRSSDGQRICSLESADISEMLNAGWTPPEVFTAKGRDGVTDIWGIVSRPAHFDPMKKYPVIEDIYAGPHGSFVPKSFSPGRTNRLTELGFWVVQIDGMGTANRSKSFHDVCWQNLKDAGFPDRILWHQALAQKYPQYDITRVGIYGTSAGGQESTAAVLFHPEFYRVAVSACGCHDNRMDKASWNEQWMGYPVGPQYSASSNIDHASLLQGHLLLIVGELDDNVPPESTLRLADALIKSNKEFELMVIPGLGHSNGGPYGVRKMQRFMMHHLHPRPVTEEAGAGN